MNRLARTARASRGASIVLGAAVLTVAGSVPAYAAYETGGSNCREGGSGRACAHVEIDRSTGNIRARGAGDAIPASGNVIVLDSTQLEQRIVERSSGLVTSRTVLDIEEKDVATSNPVVSQIAGPFRELCDNPLRIVEYRSTLRYYVIYANGQTPYEVTSGWRSGRC